MCGDEEVGIFQRGSGYGLGSADRDGYPDGIGIGRIGRSDEVTNKDGK
jgi:hypothetical protein